MRKKSYGKRILALAMSVAIAVTTAMSGSGMMFSVKAASTYEAENLLVNPDFEDPTAFSPAGGSHAGNWFYWQRAAKTTDDAQSGHASAKFTGSDSALEQDVPGLQKGMTYVYSVWAKLSGTSATAVHTVGVKNYGGDELKRTVTSTEWEKIEIEFVYTGGTTRVYGYTQTHGGVDMYIDNASLSVKSDIREMSIQNGQLDVMFADSYAGEPDVSDFSATYFTSADRDNVQTLTLTKDAWENQKLTLSFDEVRAIAVAQTVTVNIAYKGQTITLDYQVDASGEEAVTANIAEVTAENGSVTVLLDAVPTVAPKAEDFTWEYRINDGTYRTLEVKDFSYSGTDKTVTVSFDEIRGIPSGDQRVNVKVTYHDIAKEDSFTVEAGESHVYYVDSTNGSDSYDGLTEDTAFASISKLNKITFFPGDQILFKKGETFVGCFKPQGSGSEAAPIRIGSYGEGDDRPVLQPGEDWTVDYIMSANAMVNNPKVNYVIQFYNVEYWEVSDLEIFDPNSEAYLTKGSDKYIGNSANDVYRSGITIQAEDIGTLEHIYVDNVIIHGFHGPGTNIGKTSGGITMNVISNKERDVSRSVPSQINDIRITNCEIYDVGRSGVNFLTPWSFRTEEKWGPFNYGTRGYDYLPYEDFYLGNNYIHDIDGDGTIIDNCSGAVAEFNLVTRCCLRPATEGGGAAVGLFNWNSDDTWFQFNEVFDTRNGSGVSASNDGQGIEIDALNDRTWVQYNYVHDNMGGFMMLCNVADSYRSFDGIVRYNISQDDYAHPRQGLFDIYAANYGTEIYNNTFYLTERALKPNQSSIFLFSSAGAYETMKFYNNIFYYDGKTPAAANTFADGAIDWQSNIFYGFTNMPQDDNAGAPNISADPMLVNIGQGGTGTYPGDQVDLSCYYTTDESPAINAGVPLENNGGRDYFGNAVTGIPDIGAYESGSVVLKIMSAGYAFNQEDLTVEVVDLDKVTADDLMSSLIVEDGVTTEIKRGATVLTGGVRLETGDVVTAEYHGETISYTVSVVKGESDDLVAVSDMRATAGSEERSQASDVAENVLDGNTGTMWHTDWTYSAPEDRWITIELTNAYDVTGYIYTPRATGTNGVITRYAIYASDDNQTWETVAEGNWAQDNNAKTVIFDQAVNAKYFKLLAVSSVANFASAAEIRLLGTRCYNDTTAPTTPVLAADRVTDTTVHVTWTASEDESGIAEYVLKQDDQVIATFDPDEYEFTVGGLTPQTEYTFAIYAVDAAGNQSETSEVKVTTAEDEVPSIVFEDVVKGTYYYDAVIWAVNHGVTSGWTETAFAPEQACTRGQAVTFLWRANGCEKVNKEAGFEDVAADAYYAEAVAWAVEEGITEGWTETEFRPEMTVTRGQVVTFLHRANGTPKPAGTAGFEDVPADAYYAEAVAWAVEEKIVEGWSDTQFAPELGCTRGQIVTSLYRAE
ncbi:MAG: S-layer homology domain-containing protein [Lachnospiraceae bacterium]